MKKTTSDLLNLTGKSFIYYWFILFTVTTIGFILGTGITTVYSYISLIVLAGVLTYLYKDFKLTLKIIIGLLFIMITSILISLQIWDFGYDGRGYHFTAVQALSEGWNPFYFPNLGSFPGYTHHTWVESYPKSNWIFIANNLQLFNNIDAAKYINYMLLIISAFMLNKFFMKDIKNILIRLLFILPIILNPVAIGQINTLYLDGNLYFLILLFAIALTNYYASKNIDNFFFLMAITIILLNIKFTAIVFLIIGFILFFLLEYIKLKKPPLLLLRKWFIVLLLGIGYFGFSPYINNIHYYGNPLYPVAGENKRDVISTEMNNEFLKLNRFQMFFYSINSKPSHDRRPFPEIRNPIQISLDINNYKKNCHDLRVNGFGPLYSVVLFLAIIGLLYALYRKYTINKYFIIATMFIIMSFSIPTTWWARLIPMMWAVPIFFSLYFYTKSDRLLRSFSIIILLLLVLNASLLSRIRLRHDYHRTSKELQSMNAMVGNHISISFKKKQARAGRGTILHKLNSNNIKYTIIKKSECKKTALFYDVTICDVN